MRGVAPIRILDTAGLSHLLPHKLVMLNLFQHPFGSWRSLCRSGETAQSCELGKASALAEKWALKQVQGDGAGRLRSGPSKGGAALAMTAALLLASCHKSFDERYAEAQKKMADQAASIDRELAAKASEAALAPVVEPTQPASGAAAVPAQP